MATIAFHAKDADMDFWFFVAANTITGGTGENLIGMTGFTIRILVCSIEYVNMGMFEIRHAVASIMTGNTIGTKEINMFGGAVMIFSRMTANTIQRVASKAILAMTTLAAHHLTFKVCDMFFEAKASQQLMIDILESKFSNGSSSSLMLDMAGFTLIDSRKTAVQTGSGRPLLSNFHMAVLALRIGNTM
jgi:hypothetical protein